MCGICGFTGTGNVDDIERMNASLYHRGPDDGRIWQEEKLNLYFGHRRLSIIDITGGSQPMHSLDKSLCIIYNGEIYNHIELRKELQKKGYLFRSSHSDTEVLIYGYQEWGTNLPNKLNGMWAFAIYDSINQILFLSRDRFGKKPLFYTLQNGLFAFASELSSFKKHSEIKCSISILSLKKYFAYGYIPAPNSIYEKIYKLPAGHNLIFNFSDRSIEVEQYWEFLLEPFEEIPKNPEQEWGEQLRDLFEKAVTRRLMSDVPLGIFLSGGIDSSAVTAFAAKKMGFHKVDTFSIGFHEKSFDESDYACYAADLFKTNHHLSMLSIEEAKKALPGIISQLDEPMGDSSLLPTFLLSKETRKYVTVALGGDGGDELFAGYDPFKALKAAEFYNKFIPKPVHQAIRLMGNILPVSHSNFSFDFKIKRTLRGLSYPKYLWLSAWMSTVDPKELEMIFDEPVDIEDVYSEAINCWEKTPQTNMIDKTLTFYIKLYLQDDILVKTDRASMMNSLEVRAPFLDIDFVDFVRKIPNEWKYRNGTTKYILKKALEPVLPSNIINRKKKGFGVPVGKWFHDNSFSLDPNSILNFIDKEFISDKINKHQNLKSDERALLWNTWLLSKMNL